MINIIELHTNENIERVLAKIDDPNSSGKFPFLKKTNRAEIEAFLGLMYYRGLYNAVVISTRYLFSNTK